MHDEDNYSITKRNLIRGAEYRSVEYGSFSSHWKTTILPIEILKWEMPHGIVRQPCPFCDHGRSFLNAELRNFGDGEIIYVFYQCDNCSERFTSTEIDMINFVPLTEKRRRRKLIIKTVIEVLNLKIKDGNNRKQINRN